MKNKKLNPERVKRTIEGKTYDVVKEGAHIIVYDNDKIVWEGKSGMFHLWRPSQKKTENEWE